MWPATSKAFQWTGRCKCGISFARPSVVLSWSEAVFGGVVMNMHYRIGEFAELGGVSPKTLRFYDEIGLLRPASVDPRTGYRHYLPQQLEQLASILAFKNLGVSLAKLRELTTSRASVADRRNVLN